MNYKHTILVISTLVASHSLKGEDFTFTSTVSNNAPANTSEEAVVVQSVFIPSEEEVLKALYTLGLSSYKNLKTIREHYQTKSASNPSDFLEHDKAYKLLSNSLVESKYAIESFLYDFQLKAKESKIESFDNNYNRFKSLLESFRTECAKAYFFNDLAKVSLPGKKLWGKYCTESILKFNHAQTTYYMDPAKTRRVLNRGKEELSKVDPSKMFFADELKLIDAEECSLKNFEKMPGQAIARNFLAKKIK